MKGKNGGGGVGEWVPPQPIRLIICTCYPIKQQVVLISNLLLREKKSWMHDKRIQTKF